MTQILQRLRLCCFALCLPVICLAQQNNGDLRDHAIENIGSVLFEPKNYTNANKIKAFEDECGVKLQFRVENESLDQLGGLSEHLFKLWQTFVTPVNVQANTITGEFSVLQDEKLSELLTYKTLATQDLRACVLSQDKTGKLDSAYNKYFSSQLEVVADNPASTDNFYTQAAYDYQSLIFQDTACPDRSNFNAEEYTKHVLQSSAYRAAFWLSDVYEISGLLKAEYSKLDGSFVPSVNTGTAAASFVVPKSSEGEYIINKNGSINECTEKDMEVRCEMLFAKTNIRYLFLTKTLQYFIPLDSLNIFRDAVTQDLMNSYPAKNIIVVLWLKCNDGNTASTGVFRVRQNGDFLSKADLEFANRNNGGNYYDATFYKFNNIFRNIPKPLILCYQVAKINGLLTTVYFQKAEKIKGREQIYYHSFKLDKAFYELQAIQNRINSLAANPNSGGGFVNDTNGNFHYNIQSEFDALRNEQKRIYIRACLKPDLVETERHIKDQHMLDRELVHAAGLKFLKDNFGNIYPDNRIDEQMGNKQIPTDLLAGTCDTYDQSAVIEDVLNLTSLMLSPVGLDFIPDALAVAYYVANGRTLDAFMASANFFVPGSLSGIKKVLSSTADVFTAVNKGKKIISEAGILSAIDQDINSLCSVFKLDPSDVDAELVGLINANPTSTEKLLNLNEPQSKLWSNTEKLDPKKRVEFVKKCYAEPAWALKCLDDLDEVLRWGGVFSSAAKHLTDPMKSIHNRFVEAGARYVENEGVIKYITHNDVEVAQIKSNYFSVTAAKPNIPSPAEYLSQTFITNHLNKFSNEGCGFIVIKSWTEGGNPIYSTLPSRKFVALRSEMDGVIKKYRDNNNDWTILRDELNLGDNVNLSGEEIYYIKIDGNDPRFTYDLPTGNESGAIIGEWVPCGKTKNGISEAALVGSEKISHDKNIEKLLSNFEGKWEKIK